MPSKTFNKFTGMITTEDNLDIPDDACVQCKNMKLEDGIFKTRCGCKKLGSVYTAGKINLIYHFERKGSGTKTIIASGGSIYA